MEFLNKLYDNSSIMDILNKLDTPYEIKDINSRHYNGDCCYVFLTKPKQMDNLPKITLSSDSKKYLKVMSPNDIYEFFDDFINVKCEYSVKFLGKQPVFGPNAHGITPEKDDPNFQCNYCLERDYNELQSSSIIWYCEHCNKNMCDLCYNKKDKVCSRTYKYFIPSDAYDLINKTGIEFPKEMEERRKKEYEVYHKLKYEMIDKCKEHNEFTNKYVYNKRRSVCNTCYTPIYENEGINTHYDIDDKYFFIPHYTSLGKNERIFYSITQNPVLHICKDCYDNDVDKSRTIVEEKGMRLLDRYSKECYQFEATGLNSMLYWIPIITLIEPISESGSWVFMNLNPDDINYKKFAFMTTDDECNRGFFVADVDNFSLDDLIKNLDKASVLLTTKRRYYEDMFVKENSDDESSMDSNDSYYTKEGDTYGLFNPINIVMIKKFDFWVDYHSMDGEFYF